MTPAAGAGIKQPQRIALCFHTAEQFDGFQRLQGPHHAYHRAQYARGAAVALRLGIIRPQAAITALRPGRGQHHHLPAETDRTGGDKWRILCHAGGVNGLAGRHIVGAVQHRISKGDFALQSVAVEPLLVRDERDVRVQLLQPFAGDLRFGLVNILRGEEDLSLQITDMYLVVIGQNQRAHARACQIERGRSA